MFSSDLSFNFGEGANSFSRSVEEHEALSKANAAKLTRAVTNAKKAANDAEKAEKKAQTLLGKAKTVAIKLADKTLRTAGYHDPIPQGQEYTLGTYAQNSWKGFTGFGGGNANRGAQATSDYWSSVIIVLLYGLLGFFAVTSGAAGAIGAFLISVIFVVIASQFGTYMGKYLPMINVGIFGIVIYIVAYIFLLRK